MKKIAKPTYKKISGKTKMPTVVACSNTCGTPNAACTMDICGVYG